MRSDHEIELLLQIVKGSALPEITESSFSAPRLIQLAERHKVVYQLLLFAQQHETLFTGEQIEKLNSRCRNMALHSLTQLHELKRIAAVFNEKGMGYLCIKGPQLSRMIYGREALKESVDLDIMLLHQEDLTEAHTILSGLGYTRSNLNRYKGKTIRKIFLIAKREVQYFNRESRCAIDLHIRPGANTYLTAKYFKDFFSDLQKIDLEGTVVPVLSDEVYFVYLCYHGALHQFSRLAWLLDIRAFLALKRDTLDYEKLLAVARSLRTERSVFLAMMLLQLYFKDEMPNALACRIRKNKRMHYLVRICAKMLSCEPGYPGSFRGRAGKIMYIMMLVKGIDGKIDWFYGIFMRFVVKRFL